MNLDTPEIMNLDTPEGVFVSLLCINPHRIVAQNFERTRQEKKRHRLILYDCTEAGSRDRFVTMFITLSDYHAKFFIGATFFNKNQN